jgi:acetyl esterase/lipase
MFAPSLLLSILIAAEPNVVPLWDGPAPSSVGEQAKNTPTLTIFPAPADKATGAAVVICPGGGYGFLADDHEGKQIAEFLNARGISAYMLKYRITAGAARPGPLHPAPMLDANRAVRYVRAHAAKHQIDPKKIGIFGFSAGGHLASTAATHFDAGQPDSADPVERVSSRPDFAILGYPVISMKDGITHGGSRKNLLGDKPDAKLIEYYSNETQVTKETPPTFLFHTDEDKAVLPENSILFYSALKKAGVPAELHIFEKGVHGVGLGNDPKWAKNAPNLDAIPGRLEGWLKLRGYAK